MFSLQKEFLELIDAVSEQDGVLTEEQEQDLTVNQENMIEKSNRHGHFLDYLKMQKLHLADKIKQLGAYKRQITNLEETTKSAMLNAMNIYGLEEIKADDYLFKFRNSESVIIDCEPQVLPTPLRVVEIKPISKTEIKKWLKEGNEFEGLSIVKNKSLTIKSI